MCFNSSFILIILFLKLTQIHLYCSFVQGTWKISKLSLKLILFLLSSYFKIEMEMKKINFWMIVYQIDFVGMIDERETNKNLIYPFHSSALKSVDGVKL